MTEKQGQAVAQKTARQSQGNYCQDCIFHQQGLCNVILKDGEDCGELWSDLVNPREVKENE